MLSLLTTALQALGQAGEKVAAATAPVAEKAAQATAAVAEKAAQAAPAAADTASKAAEGAKQWYETGALGYMIEGGFFMWPILILGILAFGVIIERFRSLKMLSTDTGALRGQVLDLLQADRVDEAFQLCDNQQGPVPAILAAGLRKLLVLRRLNYDPGKIEEQVVKAMDDYGIHISAALERHLPILATVSSVAPMLGFLGTVQGMVVSFKDIVVQVQSGQGANIILAAADGIKISLLTTVLGLIVGIPAFTAFNYFTSVINRFVLDVEESATELIEAVTLQMSIDNQASDKSEAT
jgi:biopolymer transport protein ExbB